MENGIILPGKRVVSKREELLQRWKKMLWNIAGAVVEEGSRCCGGI